MAKRLFVGGTAHGRVMPAPDDVPSFTRPVQDGESGESETYDLRIVPMEGMDRADRRWTRVYLRRGSDPSIGVVLDAAALALGLERNHS